jgi:lysozyme|tara:strand:- start:38 stop:481 length:444 start_codon:yes stop_codon:yes gene_type:complete
MNIEQLQEELENDEGVKYEVYLDHLGYPTFGIGHLITDDDPECGASVGTEISRDRVKEAFETDVETVLSDCERLYVQFEHLPEEVKLIIANMMFNMGRPRLSKFKGMKRGVDARDWNAAADEMVDSAWYRQVPNRAERLVTRMRNVG